MLFVMGCSLLGLAAVGLALVVVMACCIVAGRADDDRNYRSQAPPGGKVVRPPKFVSHLSAS